jgi:hypothetical protein
MQIPPPYAEIAGKVGETKRRLDNAAGSETRLNKKKARK